MGIETRRPRQGLDRCKYYKGILTAGNKLTADETCLGIFYSNDLTPLTSSSVVSGNIARTEYRITIQTHDIITELAPNDFVLYDGNMYIVEKVESKDENDHGKQFRSNPTKKTIYLRR